MNDFSDHSVRSHLVCRRELVLKRWHSSRASPRRSCRTYAHTDHGPSTPTRSIRFTREASEFHSQARANNGLSSYPHAKTLSPRDDMITRVVIVTVAIRVTIEFAVCFLPPVADWTTPSTTPSCRHHLYHVQIFYLPNVYDDKEGYAFRYERQGCHVGTNARCCKEMSDQYRVRR